MRSFFMGRQVGFEPTHIGTTIRGLNRLTTSAISLTLVSITNKYFKTSIFTQKKGGATNNTTSPSFKVF